MNLTEQFWEKVYRDNFSRMIGLCYRYVQNKEAAEDIAQDAFITAINKSGTFKGKGSFEAWLRRIVVNSALQYLRKKKAEKQDLFMQNHEIMETIEEKEERLLPEPNDFSKEELLEAINNLPEHHRLVFNLYVIDNYSHSEIAIELGISQGTSKSNLSRARKNIQKQLITIQEKKSRKKGLLFLLFPQQFINHLYKKSFLDFEITPLKESFLKNVDWGKTLKPHLTNVVPSSNLFIYSGVTVGVISTSIFLFKSFDNFKDRTQFVKPDTIQKSEEVKTDTLKMPHKSVELNISDSVRKPVVIKKTIIRHRAIIIKNTIKTNDTANAK